MYGTSNAPPQPVGAAHENTLLEEHLKVLRSHASTGRDIIDRLERLADRLVGAVPQAITKEGQPKEAVEPPLVTRIDHAGRDLTGLLAQIHEQISRLERL